MIKIILAAIIEIVTETMATKNFISSYLVGGNITCCSLGAGFLGDPVQPMVMWVLITIRQSAVSLWLLSIKEPPLSLGTSRA